MTRGYEPLDQRVQSPESEKGKPMTEDRHVVIVRGPSGSGKSTYVRDQLVKPIQASRRGENVVRVLSADQFWLVPTGYDDPASPPPKGRGPHFFENGCWQEYVFDVKRIAEAHNDCFYRFLVTLQEGVQFVIVDNTFTRHWEYANYLVVARMTGYVTAVHEICPKTVADVRQCIARNAHYVPAEIVTAQVLRFEPDKDAKRILFPRIPE